MRRILTGVDSEGRSYVVDDSDVPTRSIDGLVIRAGALFGTVSSPPEPAPPQVGQRYPVGPEPGLLRWSVIDHQPRTADTPIDISATVHHQDAIELVFVVSGNTHLVVDTEERAVHAGDCVVLPGVNHAWRDDEHGCRLLVTSLGMLPSA